MEHIIGTAGHVDHGKTVLVKALTGVDTDRLKAEKERGISIELGFAPLTLPSGRRLGLVDVPGHERFIRQMLAGVGGMDIVMLVIAADEGVMPQTKEHLAIIDLLQVKQGIIVVTKIDLVETDWLELVKDEVRQEVKGTVLESASIIAVSAVTGEGIPKLLEELDALAAKTPSREEHDKVRLPVDRVFSITGFGTVVTGTLWSGVIRAGDELEILPEGIKTKARNLQVHGEPVKEARAGQRVAVNLSGVEVDAVSRGSCLLTPGFLTSTRRLDASFKLLENVQTLGNRSRIRFYLGTGETFGRVIFLDRNEMKGGEEALVQIVLEEPVVADRNDRFILRSYSPMKTIGGGLIIDPSPLRHRRFKQSVLDSLKQRLEGSPEEILEQVIREHKEGLSWHRAAVRSSINPEKARRMLQEMAGRDQIKLLLAGDDQYVVSTERYKKWWQGAAMALKEYHSRYPLRSGLGKEELRSRYFSHLPVRVFHELLDRWSREGLVKVSATTVALVDFEPQLSTEQQKLLQNLEERYKTANWQPPGFNEIMKEFNLNSSELEEFLHYLSREGKLVKINEDFYWHHEAFKSACEAIKEMAVKGPFGLAEVRDLLGSSRKYVLPFLEYLDQVKITRRQGDKRIYLAG